MYVLEARDLRKSFGEGEAAVEALRGVNLGIQAGEMLAIMGRSGSGKSTMLTLLGGVDVPTSGQVLLEGTDLASLDDDGRTLIRRRRIGFVFQAFNLLPILTAEENVALPLELDGVPSKVARERAVKTLELVGLAGRRTHLPGKMSGGEQQRVAIARALVIEPAIVLADEPTGNLDSANSKRITHALRELVDQHGQTIIMVTHDPKVAEQADRVIHLMDGEIRREETNRVVPVRPRRRSGIRSDAMSLRNYTVRAMQQRPGRSILTMLSIVIGVAAAVAVGLGTATTRNAYKQMFAMVTGRTTLEVDAAGGGGFDADVFEKVAAVPGVQAAAPLLQRGTKLSIGDGERQLKLEVLGIDPEHDTKVRDYEIVAGRQVEEGNELVLDEGFAQFIGLKLDDEVKLLTNRRAPLFTVVGLIRPKSGAAAMQMAMTFMPLEAVQYYFSPRKRNVIDKIQVVTAPKDDPDKIRSLIAEVLHTVTLTAVRGEETIKAEVHLKGKLASAGSSSEEPGGDTLLGVEGEDTDDNGAKITKVAAGGLAEGAGLKAGDIVTELDEQKIASYTALSDRIKNRWGVQVHRPTASTQLMQETLTSTEQGLTLTTAFSILMAAFIILNTFLMNVSERRRHLSILRAIGAKKGQISGMLLGESILLGILGTLVGLGLGVLIAFFATTLVGRAFDVQLPSVFDVMTPTPFILGTTFGMVMALVGALVPALLAAQVSPLEGMNRVANIKKWDFTRYYLIFGPLLTIGALIVMYGSIAGWIHIDAATYAAVALLIGLVLIDITIFDPQASFVAWLLKFLSPVEASMALRQVLRNHMRSALTVAVLFIAGSTGVGMASSIIDCVHNVAHWFDKAITADYVIRALMPDMATGTAPDLPEELRQELAEMAPGLKIRYEGMSFIQAKVPRGKDESEALTVIAVAREYLDPKPPPFDLIEGKPEQLREQLLSGEVVIGSVLQMKTGLKLGDKLPLETKEGVQQVPICGVANEYMVGGLAVHMARPFAERWLGVEGFDGYIVKVLEGDPEAVRPKLEALAKKHDVLLMSQADIKKAVDQFQNGTVWSLWALVCMGFVVAAFGVVNTLTMNVLEQTRELGLLRIVAMTKKQVRRTIVMQALIIGGVGLPPGILLGVCVAYVINLAMMPSFGHSVQFQLHPWMLLGTFAGALAIVLIAAIIPAKRATRINVVEGVHYE